MSHVAVIDIGKTNAKLALVDTATLTEVAVVTRPNRVLAGPPWPHFDVDGHWSFLLDALAGFQASHGIDAISVTTHGACVALLDADGDLAAPVLDYEHDGPQGVAADYDALRPPFSETGSPRLANGLNVGAQLHWQFAQDSGLRDRTHAIVTYPQFWGARLTGQLATDVTSLGCHTDLWNPGQGALSALVDTLGIRDKIAAPRPPAAVLGPILPQIAARTGLAPDTPVHCGIHDSNASLLPHLLRHDPPFSVVSTGTWVIVLGVGGADVALDPADDTLINVDAFGAPVRSARFMGGREHDVATGGPYPIPTEAELADVLDRQVMLTPAVMPETGPFQGQTAGWIGAEPAVGSGQRGAAVAFYLALVTARCLTLIGHRGSIVVEGPFSQNAAYRRMLSHVTGCPTIATGGATGTSQGAALLAAGLKRQAQSGVVADHLPPLPDGADAYIQRWRNAAGLQSETGA
ncbi:FGGY-family carbohydrate kinase [Loktanella sp. SALINAS62]|uniref:FGGY-family carbohydrate kinase n=1 Tax=Loktanella sp. SALINAS62 TaxID=2706124 RepID=UPI001B8B5CCF|nr:FGGY-family carbohydrate kinase [Loktanella sp. SALINAS62]MBS1302722.1 carbohydrate kinase [Loktanella sp. SALINAS62]